jgi:hypothetical protein
MKTIRIYRKEVDKMPSVADLFLDKTANDKLHLYTALHNGTPGTYSYRTVDATFTEYGLTRARSLLGQIDLDLAEIMPEMPRFMDDQGDVQIDDRLPAPEVYFQYLVTTSLAMQAMGYMLHHPEGTIQTFGKTVFLSPMTVIRRLKPLADYLAAQYGIRINMRQLDFVGSEPLIRYMIYNLLVDIGLCTADEYSERYPELVPLVDQLAGYLNPYAGPIVIRERLLTVLGVGLERAEQGFAVTDTTIPDLWFDLPEKDILADILAQKQLLHADAELAFAAFAVFSGPVVLSVKDKLYHFVADRLTKESDRLAGLTDELAAALVAEMGSEPCDEQWSVLLVNTYLILMPIFYFQQSLPVLFPLIRTQLVPNNRHYQDLRRCMRVFWEKIARRKDCYWLHRVLDQITNLLTYLFWRAYREQLTQHHLRVSLRMGLSYHLQQPVRSLLAHIPFVDMVPYSPSAPPDLLIVSAPRYVPKNWHRPVYHFGLASCSDDTQQLHELLSQAYTEKNAVD